MNQDISVSLMFIFSVCPSDILLRDTDIHETTSKVVIKKAVQSLQNVSGT